MIQTITYEEWPAGLDLVCAFINLSPEQISQRLKADFEETYDDLDWFKVLIFKVDDKGPFAFRRYRNTPVFGTDLLTLIHTKDFKNDIEVVLNVMGLDWSVVKSAYKGQKT